MFSDVSIEPYSSKCLGELFKLAIVKLEKIETFQDFTFLFFIFFCVQNKGDFSSLPV